MISTKLIKQVIKLLKNLNLNRFLCRMWTVTKIIIKNSIKKMKTTFVNFFLV